MKPLHKFIKQAGFSDENSFYEKYPTQEDFFRDHPNLAPKQDIKNPQTFGDAFREARKSFLKGGDNTFMYKGKKYTTDLKEDLHKKEYHTPEERNTYHRHITESVNKQPNNLFNPDYFAKQRQPTSEEIYSLSHPGIQIAPTLKEENLYKTPDRKGINPYWTGNLSSANNINADANWSKNVLDPAMTIQMAIDVAPKLAVVGMKSLLGLAKNASKKALSEAMIKQSLKGGNKAVDNFLKENVAKINESDPLWASEFENSGQSPITQWSNSPTLLHSEYSGLSPIEQVADMEHAWSPISRAGGQKQMYNLAKKAYPEQYMFEDQTLSPMEQMGRKQIEKLSKAASKKVNMKGYNIDDYEPGAFSNGGLLPYYQEGSTHEMTMKEIKQLEKMGYKLKY